MKMRWLAGLAGWVASVTAGSLLCAASTGEVHVSSGQDAEKGVLFIRVLNSNGQMIASGSGFLVDDHGSLVTCLSVIQPRGAAVAAAETISVNGRITPVKGLLALDESLDLALVQLTEMPEGCTALSLDTSTRSRIGEIVCAVGHPQGFRMVSTTGAVNAAYTTRELPPSLRSCECMLAAEEVLWLETSARVGYGHAGAPLVDAIHGRVLGVVESKVLQSGTNLVLHAAALPGFLAQPRALVGLAEASAPEAEVVRLVNGFNYAFSRYQNARSPHSDIFFHLARTEIPPHPALTQVPQLLRLAESNRGGRVEYRALEALLMAASTKDCPLRLTSEVQQASARMLELYRDDRRLRWMLQRLPMPQLPSVRDFLRELAAKSSREDTKVFATLALARTLEDERGKADAAAEALRLAQSVKDCDPGLMFGSEFARTVARDIAERLGAISIGAPAPALVGTDASGQPLDLKEMKGRYVAVVFWTKSGDFFDTAQATMSKVMSDYAGAPLAVLGVRLNDERMGSTSYSSFPAPKVETDEERMRVLIDTRDNQIRRAWHVRAVPAAFLIDREGHIAGHFVNESSNPRATVTDRAVFANSSDMKPGRWADDLIAAMESTPAISEGRHELLAIVTNGPWIATGNWDPSSPGDRTVFFQPNGKASANWIEEWHVHTPNILHLKLWRDGWAKVKVNADTGEGILTGRTNVTARVLRRREMTVPAGESELARKTRETLRAGPWSWFEHGNPGREASSLTLNFASNGTFNVVQFRAWEVLSNGQVRIYRSNDAY